MAIRTLVAFAAIAIAVLALAIALSSGLMIERFDAIEKKHVAERATQALTALEADLNQLALSTRDYAEWDDAQNYILTGDLDFVRANFSYDSLAGMQVDVVAIVEANGALLYAAQLDQSGHRLVPELPTQMLQQVRSLSGQIEALRAHASSARMLRMQDGRLLAFSIVEISRSDLGGATGAAMFFGRYLDADEVERVRKTSHLPVKLMTIDAATSAAVAASDLRAWQRVTSGTLRTDAAFTDDKHVTGYALVSDFKGQPLAVTAVTEPRDIGSLGRRTTYVLLGAIGLIALSGIVMLLVLLARLHRQWEQRLALKTHHQRILACLEECILLSDADSGRIIDANDALLSCLGFTRSDLPQLTLKLICVDMPDLTQVLRNQGQSGPQECRLRASDGRFIEAEVNATTFTEDGRPLLCIVARDLSWRRQAEQSLRENQSRLTHLAEHNSLTGLPNRAFLQHRMPALLHSAAAREESFALLHLDLDHFKNVNSRGHDLGDLVLKNIASRLRNELSTADLVLHLGADEFLVITAAIDGPSAVRDRAQQILSIVGTPVAIDDSSFALSASIGIAIYPNDGLDADSLLKHADIALYQAKENGRAGYLIFTNDMDVQMSEHVALEQALRRALNTTQIHLAYQPVVDLNTGRLISFEALARWTHPQLGLIPPGRFIPVAEKSGLIVQLGEQIVRDVIAQMREWQRSGLTLAPVAINVSPQQLERTNFSTYVHETALQYDVDPQLIAFEVTESALMQDSNKHFVIVDSLRHAGSRIYIDDFGTGFSNLSYLKTLPVDALKIDQSFVRHIHEDANDVAIVSSIISMANQLNLDTIAEGIETAVQADKLRHLGCKLGQGYFFSRPVAAPHCRALLEQLGASRRFTETVKVRALRQIAG